MLLSGQGSARSLSAVFRPHPYLPTGTPPLRRPHIGAAQGHIRWIFRDYYWDPEQGQADARAEAERARADGAEQRQALTEAHHAQVEAITARTQAEQSRAERAERQADEEAAERRRLAEQVEQARAELERMAERIAAAEAAAADQVEQGQADEQTGARVARRSRKA